MPPIQQDLVILQGTTFASMLQWCSADAVHKAITGVQVGLPTMVTAPGHGLATRTLVWITGVRGPRDLNTPDYRSSCPRSAGFVDSDTLAIDFDSADLPAYQRGGTLTYYPPLDLTGYTARMQVRTSVGSPTTLLDLTTENGGIVIDPANGTIKISISATDSAALNWQQGVYDLELIDTSGVVTRLAEGAVCVQREVTR